MVRKLTTYDITLVEIWSSMNSEERIQEIHSHSKTIVFPSRPFIIREMMIILGKYKNYYREETNQIVKIMINSEIERLSISIEHLNKKNLEEIDKLIEEKLC